MKDKYLNISMAYMVIDMNMCQKNMPFYKELPTLNICAILLYLVD